MQEIEDIRARLDTAPPAADTLADTLVIALDAFGVLLASCRDSQERSVELFPTFAFAAAAAAEGRHILLTAPSLPGHGLVTSHAPCVQADLDVIADALADLAGALSAHLSAAARHAQDPGDRAVCQNAAEHAGQIQALLARDD